MTHIFSSDLQRAYKTASAIRTAQVNVGEKDSNEIVEVQPLVILREQDFGFYEGKPFFARPQESGKSGKDEHRSKHRDEPSFKDVESKQSMSDRMDQFLREHLTPLCVDETENTQITVAIVSHGIILSHLWRCFLKLFPKDSVTLAPGVMLGAGGGTPLEYLGGWSNTGYLELELSRIGALPEDSSNNAVVSKTGIAQEHGPHSVILANHRMIIKTVNGKEHLGGLKRMRGVGDSQYNEGQKKIETFFKKRKV